MHPHTCITVILVMCMHSCSHGSLQPCIPQSNESYRGATEVSLAFRLWGELTCGMDDASHIIDMVWLAWLSQEERGILVVQMTSTCLRRTGGVSTLWCIHASMHSCIYAYMNLCIHAAMNQCIHAFIHLCTIKADPHTAQHVAKQ
jgi:hypothetical protein